MIKIVYLKEDANLTHLLNEDTVNFHTDYPNALVTILNYWYVFYVNFIILMFISALTYFLFLRELEDIYQVFMCLE
jgi:hypothetical protein